MSDYLYFSRNVLSASKAKALPRLYKGTIRVCLSALAVKRPSKDLVANGNAGFYSLAISAIALYQIISVLSTIFNKRGYLLVVYVRLGSNYRSAAIVFSVMLCIIVRI
jgi:hypothetical protein